MNEQAYYPYKTHKAVVEPGLEIAYCDEGSGKQTLLFIHGLGNYLKVWVPLMELLKPYFRCIALDLPGNGLSGKGNYHYSMFFYAESTQRFCSYLGLKNVIPVGHSMGGQVAMVMAMRYPEHFEKLVLAAPSGIEYFSETDKMWLQTAVNLGDFGYSDEWHLRQAIHQSYFNLNKTEANQMTRELLEMMNKENLQQWRSMIKSSILGMLNEQLSGFLPQLKAHTLLLFGRNDAMIPNPIIHFGQSSESVARHGAALIPQCELKLFDQCGHFVMLEKPLGLAQAIQDFLK